MSLPLANELTKEQEEMALQRIQESQVRKVSTRQYIEDVKSSLLFRPGFNWNEMLSAAPTSVMLLASLFVASTVPDAIKVRIIPPTGGFKFLNNYENEPALNTCLVQCADTGMKSFGTAASCFDAINQSSNTIKQTVNQIIHLLGDQDEAQNLLVPTIKTLARVANNCEKKAKEVESTFQKWLDMVCELHQCVVQTSADRAEKRSANEIHLATKKIHLTHNEDAKKTAKESVDTLKASLDSATRAYQKAADEFPSGWELIAQQFLNNLSETFANCMNLAIPALIDRLDPMSMVKEGMQIFNDSAGGAHGGSAGDGKQDHREVPAAKTVPPPVPSATPPFPNDPAYGIIGYVVTYVGTIQSLVVGGKDHGIDWDMLRSTDPGKEKNGVGVIAMLMEDTRKGFKPSENPPSQDMLNIFSKVKQVTDGLQAAIKENSNINGGKFPANDSEVVKDWRVKMEASVRKAVELTADSKNLTTASSPPSMVEAKANSNPSDKNGALRQQSIDAATAKLNTAAAVMETASNNYQKASDKLVDVQIKIGEIQAELAGLEASSIDLDKIKAILIKTIEILVSLKSQINRLVGFFSAVSTIVDHVVEDQVTPFITYLRAATGADKERTLLNVTFTNYQQQMIFNSSLSIRAYFDLFKDIGGMYLDIHEKAIREGIEMVNDMQIHYNASAGDPSSARRELEKRNRAVSAYYADAKADVNKIVGAKQKDIQDNLQRNAEEAAQALEFVPVRPPPHVTKAITESANKSKEAAEKGIDASGKYLIRKLADTTSLVDDDDY